MNSNITSLAIAVLCLPGLASACWEQAAQKHAVSADLLIAVARAESSLNPRAVNRSHIARTNSVDIGLMQINSNEKMLRNLGVTSQQLLDPCTNIDAGARILAEKNRTVWAHLGGGRRLYPVKGEDFAFMLFEKGTAVLATNEKIQQSRVGRVLVLVMASIVADSIAAAEPAGRVGGAAVAASSLQAPKMPRPSSTSSCR